MIDFCAKFRDEMRKEYERQRDELEKAIPLLEAHERASNERFINLPLYRVALKTINTKLEALKTAKTDFSYGQKGETK